MRPFTFKNFAGVNFNIRRLATRAAAQRLVDLTRVRQQKRLPFARQSAETPRGRLSPPTNGADVWLNKLHGVIDGHPRSNYAAGG